MNRHSSFDTRTAQRQSKSAADRSSSLEGSLQLKMMPPPVQRQVAQMEGMDEEPVSPKMAPAQLEGMDEEPISPKMNPVQMEGALDEDPISPKMAPVQMQTEEEAPVLGKFESPIQRQVAPENKTGLPDQLKAGVESLSGHSLDSVKVHYNSDKPAQLNALAYAQGTDIHVGPGQEQHLPHETWHVAQQMSGRVQATTQLAGGVPANTDPGLEHEADVMGAKALQMKFEAPVQMKCNACASEEAVQTKPMIQMKAFTSRPSFTGVVQRSCYAWSGKNCAGTRKVVSSLHNAKNKGNKSWSPNANGVPCNGKATMSGHC